MFFLCFGLVAIYVSVSPSRARLKSLVAVIKNRSDITKNRSDVNKNRSDGNMNRRDTNKNRSDVNKNRSDVKLKRILFYHLVNFQRVRNVEKSLNYSTFFEQCEVKNCLMTFNKSEAPISDAVIINLRNAPAPLTFKRPRDQVWIFIQHEPTAAYSRRLFQGMQNSFNWTMTFSEQSDLPLPYGTLKLKSIDTMPQRDYLAISKNKTTDALWIVSHCPVWSNRKKYVDILKQYVNIDILGKCGRKWDCGKRHNHEAGDCFSILNSTYRYYLAFESALCNEYITEKFYENYKYDIIQVMRASNSKHRSIRIDKNVYVNTADFKNVHDLGRYLQTLNLDKEKYAKMLSEKDRYEAVPYVELLKERVCEICMRLNKLEDYKKVYEDVYSWMLNKTECFKPTDI